MTEPRQDATPPAEPPHDTKTETHSEPAPGAGGAGDDPHASAAAHQDAGGHDDHGHAEEPLGPIDVWAWGAGALGILVAAAMVLCFAIATEAIPVS